MAEKLDTTPPKECPHHDKLDEELTSTRRAAASRRIDNPCQYTTYLGLDKLLTAAEPVTRTMEGMEEAHDEHLFIIVHQAYELWFKQILHDLDSVMRMFGRPFVPMRDLGVACDRLHRISEIFRVLMDQLTILETMSPMSFLEFRDVLFPASGFQSLQFRKLENKLGLRASDRMTYGRRNYCSYLRPDQVEEAEETEKAESLHDMVERWLERTPYLSMGGFNFWEHYEKGVDRHFGEDEAAIRENDKIGDADKEAQLKELEESKKHFQALFDKDLHESLRKRGDRRLSYKAMQAALIITLYSGEPVLHLPARFLRLLQDLDELLTLWRHRHSLMVHRMLGAKIGTGGSSGYHYLRATASRHRIFNDFCNLSTYLIPRISLPHLPEEVVMRLGAAIEDKEAELVESAKKL